MEATITDYFWQEIEDTDVEDRWFQQLATHREQRYDVLGENFRRRIISNQDDVNWLPRSGDLTPMDFFLRGLLESRVFFNKPETLEHLKTIIRQVLAEITPEMLRKSHRKLPRTNQLLQNVQK